MRLDEINWAEIKQLPRERREDLTVKLFSRIRPRIPAALGGSKSVVGGLVARGWVSEVGWRPGEPVSSLMLYALAMAWLDLLPQRERLLTIGQFIEQRPAWQVRKYLKENGIKVSERNYWYLVYSPENKRDYRKPAVVDYWAGFSLRYFENKKPVDGLHSFLLN